MMTDISCDIITSLEKDWNSALRPPKSGPFFADHFVSLLIPVQSDWITILKSAIDTLSNWAEENAVTGGCFFCGKDDSSVYLREIMDQNTYICDDCEVRLHKKDSLRLQEEDLQNKYMTNMNIGSGDCLSSSFSGF